MPDLKTLHAIQYVGAALVALNVWFLWDSATQGLAQAGTWIVDRRRNPNVFWAFVAWEVVMLVLGVLLMADYRLPPELASATAPDPAHGYVVPYHGLLHLGYVTQVGNVAWRSIEYATIAFVVLTLIGMLLGGRKIKRAS